MGKKDEPIKSSNWTKVKNYVNTIENESLITRKQLINNLQNVPHATIDVYRRYLTDLNVLLYVKPGTYKKIQNIPEKMTVTQILKFFNLSKWRRWFTPLDLFMEELKKSKLPS